MELSRQLEEPALGRAHLPPRRAKRTERDGPDAADRSQCRLWCLGLASAAVLVLLLRHLAPVNQDAEGDLASAQQSIARVQKQIAQACRHLQSSRGLKRSMCTPPPPPRDRLGGRAELGWWSTFAEWL